MIESHFAQQITIAITGASGVPYALKLIEQLIQKNYQLHLLISSAAKTVFLTESALKLPSQPQAAQQFLQEHFQAQDQQIIVYGKEEWFSPVASGSAAPRQMVICPCSMGTLAAIAQGNSDNLIERAADVILKERGNLILVPREAPFNSIHLENMLKLSRLGTCILPAAPGFYHQPQTIDDLIDFVVARILSQLGIKQELLASWGYSR